jgi:topoisomerase-4 subunit A
MASRSEVAAVADEPVTLIVSAKGWARVRQGHNLDLSAVAYKDGDGPGVNYECRSVDSLVILSNEGRAFTVAIAALPDGRGMGAPLPSFVDMGNSRIAHVLVGKPEDELLVAKTSGYGFICTYGDLLSRQKAGKAFLTVEDGATILPPTRVIDADHLAALSEDGRLLVFPLDQMKRLSGGKGVQIIGLRDAEALRAVLAIKGPRVTIKGTLRNRIKTLVSEDRHLGRARAPRFAGRATEQRDAGGVSGVNVCCRADGNGVNTGGEQIGGGDTRSSAETCRAGEGN